MITKTAATREAARHLRYGYFQESRTEFYVLCGTCRRRFGGHEGRVSTTVAAWATRSQVCAALRVALRDHILEEHQDDE